MNIITQTLLYHTHFLHIKSSPLITLILKVTKNTQFSPWVGVEYTRLRLDWFEGKGGCGGRGRTSLAYTKFHWFSMGNFMPKLSAVHNRIKFGFMAPQHQIGPIAASCKWGGIQEGKLIVFF